MAGQFALDGPAHAVSRLGAGLINDTFLVEAGADCYVLQRINGHVFPEPERIMDNLSRLTDHLAAQPQAAIRIPRLVPAADGAAFFRDADGGVWRMTSFIPDTVVLPGVETAAQARELGRALGCFHRLVADLEPGLLAVTLPGFHVTPRYLEQLDRARAHTAALTPEVKRLLEFVSIRGELAWVLERPRREGRIPQRVTHGDPKLDNILFDAASGRAAALIDLDTVQPGLIQHDLGDCLRSCCNRRGETPTDGALALFDLAICQGILEAFARETRGLLAQAEIDSLYEGIRLMPFELGLRFLADHLEGDRYFRVAERGQNLRKAEVQLALTADIERKEEAIRAIIEDAFRAGSGV